MASSTMGLGFDSMANLTIEMPDELVRSLEEMAPAQKISVQQLAIEKLRSFAEGTVDDGTGSAAALLRALQEPPRPTVSDVDALDAAIAAGRLPVEASDLFSE